MPIEVTAGLAAVAAMLICVALHIGVIEAIIHVARRWSRPRPRPRPLLMLMLGVPLLMMSHVVQVTIFGAMLWALHAGYGDRVGELSGGFTPDVLSVWYFSVSVFTTVGFGDIVATGPIRVFVGLEAIAGLVLITWSASFTFLGMQVSWASRFKDPHNASDD